MGKSGGSVAVLGSSADRALCVYSSDRVSASANPKSVAGGSWGPEARLVGPRSPTSKWTGGSKIGGGWWLVGPWALLVARGPGSWALADGLWARLVGPARLFLWVILQPCNFTTSQDPDELL